MLYLLIALLLIANFLDYPILMNDLFLLKLISYFNYDLMYKICLLSIKFHPIIKVQRIKLFLKFL